MPTGFWLMSAALPSLSSWAAYSADWIEAKLMAMFWMNAASTSLRVNLTVLSSTLSILVMLVSIPMSVKYGNSVGYALRNGSSLLIMRLKVNSTSSALNSRVGLKYGVVWNLTPSRRWKV
ncbi:hypothetical protein D3C84_1028070 [compost metagenome]